MIEFVEWYKDSFSYLIKIVLCFYLKKIKFAKPAEKHL